MAKGHLWLIFEGGVDLIEVESDGAGMLAPVECVEFGSAQLQEIALPGGEGFALVPDDIVGIVFEVIHGSGGMEHPDKGLCLPDGGDGGLEIEGHGEKINYELRIRLLGY